LLCLLLLSNGIPMIAAGDEFLQTQGGNNNPYNQDNDTSWLDWTEDADADGLLAFVRSLIALRRRSPVLRQRAFFDGRPVAGGDGCKDLAWFTAAGHELADGDWFDPNARTLGMYLDGRGLRDRDRRGQLIVDDSYLLILHAGDDPITFALPGAPWADSYVVTVDTTFATGEPDPGVPEIPAGSPLPVDRRTSMLLRAKHNR
jgi:glycogen operon protein